MLNLWLTVLVLVSTPSWAQNKFLGNNKFFYTISPDYTLDSENPVYTVGTNKAEYVKQVFKEILSVCNSFAGMAAGDSELNIASDQALIIKNDRSLYFTVMTGCLAIPYHESRLTQFRKVDTLLNSKGKTICSIGMNNGQYLAFNKKLHDLFVSEFQDKNLVKECSDLTQENAHYQLAGSSDYLSTGLMQVAMNWNKEHVVSGDFLSVRRTLLYGLLKYVKSVRRLYSNYDTYSCLIQDKGRHYPNLIQAAWSGDFNSGNDRKSCRFKNKDDTWAANDNAFKESFDALMGDENLYKKNLTGNELKVFNLIINSMKKIIDDEKKKGDSVTLKTNQKKMATWLTLLGIE